MFEINNLFSFISEVDLEAFALQTNVNKHTKKLHSQLLFKLLIYCLVTEKDNSLRGMQSTLESAVFKVLAGIDGDVSIAHSSLSERLNVINPAFFEKIFQHCVSAYKLSSRQLANNIVRFDSTIISMSTKLINIGYNLKGGDAEKYRLLKFTIGYSDMPECICFYKDQTYNSENKALSETITGGQLHSKQINVFDRGITARDNYDKFTEKGILLVSRINPDAKQDLVLINKVGRQEQTSTVKIISDTWVHLYTMRQTATKYPVRLIRAVRKEDNTSLVFITNISAMTAIEIAEIYKSRWDIEVFFKFLKQHLNFSHLLNRTENGIKVIMYATMIAAILLTEFRNKNNLRGFKIPKKRFAQALENDILK